MGKLKFYSVDQFKHDEICRGHGYFQNKQNAIVKALEIVAKVQEDILLMREFCSKDSIPVKYYANDMKEVLDTQFAAEWKGGYNSVVVYELETED